MYILGHLCAAHLPGHLLDLPSTEILAEVLSAEPVAMPRQVLYTS